MSSSKIKVSLDSEEKAKGSATTSTSIESCDELIVKSYDSSNEALMAKAAIGKKVFSYSFGTCVAVIAKLTDKANGLRFSVFHATYPDFYLHRRVRQNMIRYPGVA